MHFIANNEKGNRLVESRKNEFSDVLNFIFKYWRVIFISTLLCSLLIPTIFFLNKKNSYEALVSIRLENYIFNTEYYQRFLSNAESELSFRMNQSQFFSEKLQEICQLNHFSSSTHPPKLLNPQIKFSKYKDLSIWQLNITSSSSSRAEECLDLAITHFKDELNLIKKSSIDQIVEENFAIKKVIHDLEHAIPLNLKDGTSTILALERSHLQDKVRSNESLIMWLKKDAIVYVRPKIYLIKPKLGMGSILVISILLGLIFGIIYGCICNQYLHFKSQNKF